MHFTKDELPPVDAFWSVTMYDADGFQVANPINRFAIGDRDALTFNDDGSLDLYVQHEDPGADKESNQANLTGTGAAVDGEAEHPSRKPEPGLSPAARGAEHHTQPVMGGIACMDPGPPCCAWTYRHRPDRGDHHAPRPHHHPPPRPGPRRNHRLGRGRRAAGAPGPGDAPRQACRARPGHHPGPPRPCPGGTDKLTAAPTGGRAVIPLGSARSHSARRDRISWTLPRT
jgi:hypothetical protein